MKSQVNFQIGKSGLTNEVKEAIKNLFQHHDQVRISILKSSSSRKNLDSTAQEIISYLLGKFSYRVIGFTIVISKLGKR